MCPSRLNDQKAYDFGVWEWSDVQFCRHQQFIHHFSFPVSNQVIPLDGHFPVCNEIPAPWFQNGTPWWLVKSTVLKNALPLKRQPEVLVNLSWRHPPGLDEENFRGPPHWPCLIALSIGGKVQPDLLATALDNVVIHGTLSSISVWTQNLCWPSVYATD